MKERQTQKSTQKEGAAEQIAPLDWVYNEIEDITMLQEGRVICFDVETTGFARTDSIIEIGAVELIDGIRTGCLFQSYIKNRGGE